MSKRKENIPKKFRFGTSNLPQEYAISKLVQKGGRINTKYPEVKWNRKKLTLTITALLIPYTTGLVVSFGLGNNLIGLVLVGLGVLVGGMYLLMRYMDRSDF